MGIREQDNAMNKTEAMTTRQLGAEIVDKARQTYEAAAHAGDYEAQFKALTAMQRAVDFLADLDRDENPQVGMTVGRTLRSY